jgi:hypothetical protein
LRLYCVRTDAIVFDAILVGSAGFGTIAAQIKCMQTLLLKFIIVYGADKEFGIGTERFSATDL